MSVFFPLSISVFSKVNHCKSSDIDTCPFRFHQFSARKYDPSGFPFRSFVYPYHVAGTCPTETDPETAHVNRQNQTNVQALERGLVFDDKCDACDGIPTASRGEKLASSKYLCTFTLTKSLFAEPMCFSTKLEMLVLLLIRARNAGERHEGYLINSLMKEVQKVVKIILV
ncbi:hypothetical protein DdX_09315 [Ditylenchus destructor]|uniref:Uncharacterized protein n=1 Tax=Ditylenchus destructor TaxID=166010 RepID=A0AAD4R0D7_9BILA|nr:hypothetical protein DdX_09315 [Ditylenchus destructor]